MSSDSASRDSSPTVPPDRSRPGAMSWARKKFVDGTARRFGASGRAEHRLGQSLGPAWRVVQPPVTVSQQARRDRNSFLAIGPGGVFAISVVDQGRQRVMIAGDVIQIKGERPPYVSQARRYAKRARSALSAAVGTTVPVVAVLTFVGSGALSAHGLPTGCLVVNNRELNRLLLAAGEKISPQTAHKLAEVAAHPSTWQKQYRWASNGQPAGDPRDKRAAQG